MRADRHDAVDAVEFLDAVRELGRRDVLAAGDVPPGERAGVADVHDPDIGVVPVVEQRSQFVGGDFAVHR